MAEYKAEKETLGPEIQRLDGKVAIITGGTTGIGRATAMLLAKRGVKVVIYGRHEQELQDALNDLKQTGGKYHGMLADQAYEDQVVKVFEETGRHFGDVDILVNNAALAAGSALDTDYEEMHYIIRANVLGYLTCIREAVKIMRARGGGQIVNVGSMSAKVREDSDIYVATKAAIEAFSESFRKKLGKENIKVSLIEPGLVGTNLPSEHVDVNKQVEKEAEGQMLEAEDIAYAIYYTLTQPDRSNVYEVRIGPIRQAI